MIRWLSCILVLGVLILGACQSTRETASPALSGRSRVTPLPGAIPDVESARTALNLPTVIYPNGLLRIDSVIVNSINAQAFPGAVVVVGKGSEIVKVEEYGTYTYESRRRVRSESVFDMASLTKVIATTTAAMILYEQGRLDLNARVSDYLDEFNTPNRREITIHHLMTHTAGLPAFRPFHKDGIVTREAVLDSIFSAPLLSEPGEEYVYSDFGMISFALVLEQITGEPLDEWCARNIFAPLEMNSTGFRGTGNPDRNVVPTEVDEDFRNRLIQGEVHDETAWILGGVSGHAGLFSTAQDLSRFAQMMVQQGSYKGNEFLRPATIRLFTSAVDTSFSTRALGWDTRNLDDEPSSAGQYFGARSYGHTGFTGTSIWIDPDSKAWVILLTNRVYPTRDRYEFFRGVRGLVADAVYEALFGPQPRREMEQSSE